MHAPAPGAFPPVSFAIPVTLRSRLPVLQCCRQALKRPSPLSDEGIQYYAAFLLPVSALLYLLTWFMLRRRLNLE